MQEPHLLCGPTHAPPLSPEALLSNQAGSLSQAVVRATQGSWTTMVAWNFRLPWMGGQGVQEQPLVCVPPCPLGYAAQGRRRVRNSRASHSGLGSLGGTYNLRHVY